MPFLVVTGILGAVIGGRSSIASDLIAGRNVDWGKAGCNALIGGAIGLGAGAVAAEMMNNFLVIDKFKSVANYTGRTMNGLTVSVNSSTQRILELAIPSGATPEQMQAIKDEQHMLRKKV